MFAEVPFDTRKFLAGMGYAPEACTPLQLPLQGKCFGAGPGQERGILSMWAFLFIVWRAKCRRKIKRDVDNQRTTIKTISSTLQGHLVAPSAARWDRQCGEKWFSVVSGDFPHLSGFSVVPNADGKFRDMWKTKKNN